jgi:hypothetical protein
MEEVRQSQRRGAFLKSASAIGPGGKSSVRLRWMFATLALAALVLVTYRSVLSWS